MASFVTLQWRLWLFDEIFLTSTRDTRDTIDPNSGLSVVTGFCYSHSFFSPKFFVTMTSDGFIVHNSNRKTKVQSKRLQIGNLCENSDLNESQQKEQLQSLLKTTSGISVNVADIEFQSSSTSKCGAIVSLSHDTDLETVITSLHGVELQGRKLIVERENPQRRAKELSSKPGQRRRPNNNNTSNPFGRKAWTKPKETVSAAASHKPLLQTSAAGETSEVTKPQMNPHHVSFESTENDTVGNNTGDQDTNTNGGVQFALSPLHHQNGKSFGEDDEASGQLMNQPVPGKRDDDNVKESNGNEPSDEPVSWSDFRDRLQKPLSELLDNYGEADPDWAKQQPPNATPPARPTDEDVAPQPVGPAQVAEEVQESRLAPHGKASIHVEVVSFGYLHGVPKEIRNGWCHAQPLPLLDCRDLPQVPPYLSRMDGLSPVIKRALTKAPTEENHRNHKKGADATTKATTTTKPSLTTKQVAKQLASETFEALRDAMVSGHGPASPLQVTIYCGSESGRHRSVVVAELVAIALRKLLRSHPPPLIPYSVSVSTRHRELDRNRHETAHQNSRRKNNNSDD